MSNGVLADITWRRPTTRIAPHIPRHIFATNYLKHGGDVQNLQRLLSHVDLNTTMIYAKAGDDTLYMDYKQNFR